MVSRPATDITILPAASLDKAKWDHCVNAAPNGSLFARYDYLWHMAPRWSGLVLNDYQAVLPLLYKSKWGIRYLTGLPFVRQLGWIGQQQTFHKEAVFKAIHRFAKYGDICFNQSNQGLVETVPQLNYEINLEQGYADIFQGYHKTVRKKLSQLHKQQNLCIAPATHGEVLCQYQALLAAKSSLDLRDDFKRLAVLLERPFGAAHFVPYKVMNLNQEALLFGMYGKYPRKIYKYMTAVTPEGRKANASVFALDHLIGQYAGTGGVFDFMGSALPGVRSFIESFGAVNRPFYLYHYNHLPWPVSLFKS